MSDRAFSIGGGDPHTGDLPPGEGHYWACEHPERPPDGLTVFDARCSHCLVGLQAFYAQGRNDLDGWSQESKTALPVTVDEVMELLADR